MHFTGHGFENCKKQGINSLLFEEEDGEGIFFDEKLLKDTISGFRCMIEFVFVASCTSEFAGQLFLNAGAHHVICVK